MNPTTRPLPPDLLARLRPLRRVARSVVLALGLLGAVVGLAAPAHAAAAGKDPEVPVSGLTRKVNEYEGQHRLGLAGGKDPELPSTPGLAGRDPELPSTPGLAGRDPEFPTTPG